MNKTCFKIGIVAALFAGIFSGSTFAQKVTDSNTPLHLLQPNYDVPYGKPEVNEITAVLDRVYNYLNNATPTKLVDKISGAEITDYSKIMWTISATDNFALKMVHWPETGHNPTHFGSMIYL